MQKVISGEVGTNILKNDVNRKLPEGTYIAIICIGTLELEY